jgi:hypothetical protein
LDSAIRVEALGQDPQIDGALDGDTVVGDRLFRLEPEAVLPRLSRDHRRRQDRGHVVLRFSPYVSGSGDAPEVFLAASSQGATDLALAGVVGRHRQVPVSEVAIQLLQVGRRRSRRLLRIAALVDPVVDLQPVHPGGPRHELVDARRSCAGVGARLVGALDVGHVDQVEGQPFLFEDLAEHRDVTPGADQAGLKTVLLAVGVVVEPEQHLVVGHHRDVETRRHGGDPLEFRELGFGQVGGDRTQLVVRRIGDDLTGQDLCGRVEVGIELRLEGDLELFNGVQPVLGQLVRRFARGSLGAGRSAGRPVVGGRHCRGVPVDFVRRGRRGGNHGLATDEGESQQERCRQQEPHVARTVRGTGKHAIFLQKQGGHGNSRGRPSNISGSGRGCQHGRLGLDLLRTFA